MQTFNVTYADGSSSSFTQNMSDWASPRKFSGEHIAATLPSRLVSDGSKDSRAFYLFAYSFSLDSAKTVRSVSLPSNRDVLVFAATLVPAGK
jgi:alpha-mannosidase